MKLFFRELGKGPPIVIMHGLMGASDNWVSIGKLLAETHHVYLLDMRNHGRSPHNEVFDYPAMAADVNEFLLDEEIRQPGLIGHSMGGKVAMSLALSYPHKIQKLIVVDIAPKKYISGFFENLIGSLLSLDITQIQSRKEANDKLIEAIPDSALRNFLLKNLIREKGNPFSWRPNLPVIFKNLSLITDGIASEGRFDKPALFIRGKNSNYILDEDMPKIKSLFPGAALATVANAGHWVHAEAPTGFLKEVKKFL